VSEYIEYIEVAETFEQTYIEVAETFEQNGKPCIPLSNKSKLFFRSGLSCFFFIGKQCSFWIDDMNFSITLSMKKKLCFVFTFQFLL